MQICPLLSSSFVIRNSLKQYFKHFNDHLNESYACGYEG